MSAPGTTTPNHQSTCTVGIVPPRYSVLVELSHHQERGGRVAPIAEHCRQFVDRSGSISGDAKSVRQRHVVNGGTTKSGEFIGDRLNAPGPHLNTQDAIAVVGYDDDTNRVRYSERIL